MENFSADRSFYEISSDLRELWDSDLDPSMPELGEDDWVSGGLYSQSQVIIHDKLMSDAVFGDTPIKTEHSYCSPSSQTDEIKLRKVMIKDESDDEMLPSVEPRKAAGRLELSSTQNIVIKTEPSSRSCSPEIDVVSPPRSVSPSLLPIIKTEPKDLSCKTVPKPMTVIIKPKGSVAQKRKHQAINCGTSMILSPSGFPWPPTPPSSSSSDSEGNVSPVHPSSSASRVIIAPAINSRQPIQTTLISCQPKGSTGVLLLTQEEKRTLVAEGYPIPSKLPLTKTEEKTLKKIRRKIKNKISAQESRRKKKEYVDTLEKRVQLLASENSEFKERITSLEDVNSKLLSTVTKLQSIVSETQGKRLGFYQEQ